ncbi:hypothetical protein ABUW04_26795 [Streptacidiphilus sp. N1-10]|uniref:Integral membrane protein n=1 Tax=Streptacidiphilus jeojiensis TaxID=3229225 RepID=A0ABV6XUC6_9ACTN
MGIESEQLVYDYLSRVGDLAQATALTAAERARLVSGLRETIDSRRPGSGTAATRTGSREAAAMKKVLDGIGRPDEVVRRAVHAGVPEARETQGGARRRTGAEAGPAAPPAPSVPVQGGPPAAESDWWRFGRGSADRGGRGAAGGGGRGESVYADRDRYDDGFEGLGGGAGFGGAALPGSEYGDQGELPGWRASYEPDFLDPDYVDPRTVKVPEQRRPEQAEPEPEPPAPPPRPGLLRRAFARPAPARPAPEPVEPVAAAPLGPLPLVESLAVLVLASGAVLALWYVAVLGWFLAYSARRLGRGAARFAGLWVPVLVAAVCGFWFYGHTHGRPPGQQLTDAQFKAVLRSTIAVWLRAAAACSALFLAWRIAVWRRR